MKFLKTIVVKVADLRANLFVRKELDSDHVLYLAELIDGGTEMKDRVRATEDMIVIDGRHRKEAYELAKVDEVKIDVFRVEDEIELISEAYKANTGGSKPPTIQDTEHTVMLLLDRGESIKCIGELLGLPASMARKYTTEVKSRMNRAKLQRAAESVTEGGLTITKAAEQYGVDVEKLKYVLSGHKRNHKQGGVAEVQRQLTKTFKTLGQKNAAAIRRILEKLEDGDITERQVREIFVHVEALHKRSAKSMSDWKARFIGMTSKSDKLAKSA